MAYLDSERPPEKYSARYIRDMVERIRTAVNSIGRGNFRSGITGEMMSEDFVKSGMIMLWYGAPEDIPLEWMVCDGQNGTPDLTAVAPVGTVYIIKTEGI